MRAQEAMFRLHQFGMAFTPECQNAQMFFSPVTGRYSVRDLRMSASARVSGGSEKVSWSWNSSGMGNRWDSIFRGNNRRIGGKSVYHTELEGKPLGPT